MEKLVQKVTLRLKWYAKSLMLYLVIDFSQEVKSSCSILGNSLRVDLCVIHDQAEGQ